ncbi:hypothetical protein [Hyphococcus luteus]|uniref:hypothetical protein n=1 Tax=Hyphococcus luteus TaxID=2058213 RepID=UPI001A9C726D|nr:hypothetical protein [Marinicaulis flavus]
MSKLTGLLKDVSIAVLSATVLFGIAGAEEAPAPGASALDKAISASKILFNTRLRFENVSQDGFADNADALTYRLRAGFETGKLWDTSLLVEFEHVDDLIGDYNSTINGNTAFPVVADPKATELNRFQVTNTSLPDTKVTLGRQRIKLDNDRFVGNVGWRQNEQTFDAVRLENTSLKGLKLDVTYVDQVNRIFGDDSSMGRWESDSWLVNGKYSLPVDGAKIAIGGFAYLLDIESAPGVSSQTYGVNASFSKGPFTLKGTYAAQSDYAAQPLAYDADYYTVEGGYTQKGFSLKAGYEVLTGDGAIGFSTPLATLHAFNGWADVFLGTPADGLEDIYVTAGYTTKTAAPFSLLKIAAVYHDFSAENTGADYGSEFGLVGVAKLDRFALLAKFASYDSDGFASDRDKFWLQLDFGF